MVDNCRHVNKITPSSDHSILNPQKWLCCVCGTTESVWACLSCAHVACGRYIDEHALKHYEKTRHPLSLEVNEKYCYCYECDDYILNDNAAGDLKILRSALSAVATQSFGSLAGRSRRILRSQSLSSLGKNYQRQLNERDRNHTALWFRRYYMLAKAFTAWKQGTPSIVKRQEAEEKRLRHEQEEEEKRLIELQRRLRAQDTSGGSTKPGHQSSARRTPQPGSSKSCTGHKQRQESQSPGRRKKAIISGVTGLRNLGNTCYMNSILQVLRSLLSCSHLREFRQFFLQEGGGAMTSRASSPTGSSSHSSSATTKGLVKKNVVNHKQQRQHQNKSQQHSKHSGSLLTRQTTQECFQHITESGRKRPGLNGGNGASKSAKKFKLAEAESNDISLSEELHALLRVMWSGKWALVSPHKMLHAVWQMIPFFKGYSQQDAQEFLCEFLDKLSSEWPPASGPSLAATSCLPVSPSSSAHGVISCVNNLITHMFHGQLVSQVTCRKCGHVSRTHEPFTDLSLEFPDRYQYRGRDLPVSTEPCHLTEMLAKFTDVEHLEGNIYVCEQCNKRRRKSSDKPAVLTEVSKQLLLQNLPHVLRLHLKRFMWSGRNHRGKITAHVAFEEELDIRPYCDTNSASQSDTNTPPVTSDNDPFSQPHSDPLSQSERQSEKETCSYAYTLSAVVMHHGRGFGSGHYTAYCWNEEADSWVHCNDAKLQMVNLTDVMKCQAYILFYTRKDITQLHKALALSQQPHSVDSASSSLFTEKADDEVTFNFENSTIPRFLELKRKLNLDHEGRMELKRRRSNMW